MANVTTASKSSSPWDGGLKPFKASYGKLMMWFFLMSDAFSFSTLLIVYGAMRFGSAVEWANPDTVYTHFPLLTEYLHWHPSLAFVGLMTFILIASSVTMVLAVEAGHRMDKATVEKYMIYTIIGGAAFVLCQGYEWYNFIRGSEFGGIHLAGAEGAIATIHFNLAGAFEALNITLEEGMVITSSMLQGLDPSAVELKLASGDLVNGAEALEMMKDAVYVKGANLTVSEYSQNPLFADLFFFITGFHGSHVTSGVILNYIIYAQVKNGTMEKRGHYEMVEKVGLYWHFLDLVWVFVFTLFYLI